MDVFTITKTVEVITVCVVLHNFCHKELDFWPSFEETEETNGGEQEE